MLLGALVLAAGVRAAAAVAPLAVPIDVTETAGVARRRWPASASVPLPRGRVRGTETLRLVGPSGGVPAQLQVLERWPDGSVRWLLADFLADVPSGGRVIYTLRDGATPGGTATPRVRLESGDGGAHILDTGPLRATVAPRGALLAELRAGGAHLALTGRALAVDGAEARPPVGERLVVETEGPIRTELLLSGRYPSGIAWEMRLAAFAGEPFVRLQHTVTNLADARFAPVRSLALDLDGRFTEAAVGVDGAPRHLAGLDAAHELRHDDATPALLDGTPTGRHADGWARASGPDAAVTVVVPSFWEEYPKAFTVSGRGLALDLFAGRQTPLAFGTGAAKTHEVWIALEPAVGGLAPGDLAAALGAPLVGMPSAAWTVASGALPQAVAPDSPGARDFLARLATAFDRYRTRARTERWDDGPPVPCAERTSEHPRVGVYGLFNWGDWQFPGYRDHVRGCDGWGNLEYDLPQVLGLAFAATGSPAFLDGFVAAARHYRDVDVIHHAPGHPDWVGLNHPHKALHFAFGTPETVDLGHTWTEGLITYHRLTGDARALAAARGIADAVVPRVRKARNPRQFGWPMLALVAAWDATGERRYLDAAREYARAGTSAFRPTPAAGDWKMGILADGVAAVHAAVRDDGLRRWLVAYADALTATPGRWPDARYALPLGYLAALTGDQRYERLALATVRTMQIGEWGKPLAAMGRTGFRLLAPLAAPASLRPSAPGETGPRRAA